MGHVVKELPWGIIDINTTDPQIFFQERWRYNWTTAPGVAAWTRAERQNFHNTIDRQIWRTWSNRIRFSVTGTGTFCGRAARGVPINFDIRWVTSDPHWTVNVRKMPAGSTPTSFISNVSFTTRIIELDSADLRTYRPCNSAGVCRADFRAAPHEFGHTLDLGDEYVASHANLADADSIMNIGERIRARHMHPIVTELNTMIPDCTFSHP